MPFLERHSIFSDFFENSDSQRYIFSQFLDWRGLRGVEK